jgi:acyl-CoA reductase-like NAD-dependent aldehyde dehydrogenase
LWLFSSAGQGKPQNTVIAPSSGKQLCSALSATDFNKVGIPVATLHDANVDDDASAYCVYDSKNGKVEMDVFYPAGNDVSSAKDTEKTVLAEVGGKFESISLPGADSAAINLVVPGKSPAASICVRKKLAVFSIDIPQSPQAREQLVTLAKIVLARLAKEP